MIYRRVVLGGSTWCSIKILGGVHQAPLYCKLFPRELLPLTPVTAEPVGDDCILCCSSPPTPPSKDGPPGSLIVLMATTYSYVVMPCRLIILYVYAVKILFFFPSCLGGEMSKKHTFRIRIMWKKKSSPSGTVAKNETTVHRA